MFGPGRDYFSIQFREQPAPLKDLPGHLAVFVIVPHDVARVDDEEAQLSISR